MEESSNTVTALLGEIRHGNADAQTRLLELMYPELKRLARRHMRRERPDHTLQPTALVHEAYLRLLGSQARIWNDRSHFLAQAAGAMRRILVDHARGHNADKRGGGQISMSLDDVLADGREPPDQDASRKAAKAAELIAVDDALTALAAVDPRQARIVELRFFGGLSDVEIARSLGISSRTVYREFRMARLWLRRRIGDHWHPHDA